MATPTSTNMLVDHVLYFDSEALIVDKPAGLPVDPPRDGGLSLENHLQGLMLGYKSWPTAVHRLDRDTSGCLMLGRSPKAHKRLGQAFEAGLVEKRYLAILDGVPESESGNVELALGKVSTREDGWRIVPDAAGKASRTDWTLMATHDGHALIEMIPATGRTHQLRVHAASGIGIPIVGDPQYGAPHPGGMMLHAVDLKLLREGKRPITAHAPFPARFVALGFSDPDAD